MEKQEILKLTVPKLREEALKIENIAGVHGMKKTQLIAVLFDHFGIAPDQKVRKEVDPEIKSKIKDLQAKKAEAIKAKDKKLTTILRRKVNRLKKLTRK